MQRCLKVKDKEIGCLPNPIFKLWLRQTISAVLESGTANWQFTVWAKTENRIIYIWVLVGEEKSTVISSMHILQLMAASADRVHESNAIFTYSFGHGIKGDCWRNHIYCFPSKDLYSVPSYSIEGNQKNHLHLSPRQLEPSSAHVVFISKSTSPAYKSSNEGNREMEVAFISSLAICEVNPWMCMVYVNVKVGNWEISFSMWRLYLITKLSLFSAVSQNLQPAYY